jgi:hypothetical protein
MQFDDIPDDVQFIILSFLTPKDLVNIGCTCRNTHIYSQNDLLWRDPFVRLLRYFGESTVNLPNSNYRHHYMNTCKGVKESVSSSKRTERLQSLFAIIYFVVTTMLCGTMLFLNVKQTYIKNAQSIDIYAGKFVAQAYVINISALAVSEFITWGCIIEDKYLRWTKEHEQQTKVNIILLCIMCLPVFVLVLSANYMGSLAFLLIFTFFLSTVKPALESRIRGTHTNERVSLFSSIMICFVFFQSGLTVMKSVFDVGFLVWLPTLISLIVRFCTIANSRSPLKLENVIFLSLIISIVISALRFNGWQIPLLLPCFSIAITFILICWWTYFVTLRVRARAGKF